MSSFSIIKHNKLEKYQIIHKNPLSKQFTLIIIIIIFNINQNNVQSLQPFATRITMDVMIVSISSKTYGNYQASRTDEENLVWLYP